MDLFIIRYWPDFLRLFTTKLGKNRTKYAFVENNESSGVVDNIFAEGT